LVSIAYKNNNNNNGYSWTVHKTCTRCIKMCHVYSANDLNSSETVTTRILLQSSTLLTYVQ